MIKKLVKTFLLSSSLLCLYISCDATFLTPDKGDISDEFRTTFTFYYAAKNAVEEQSFTKKYTRGSYLVDENWYNENQQSMGSRTVVFLPSTSDNTVSVLNPGYDISYWTLKTAAEADSSDEFSLVTDETDNSIKSVLITTTPLSFTSTWVPATDTEYKVIHLKRNPDTDAYEIETIETLYGTTEEQTQAVPVSITGYTNCEITQETIKGNGSTTVKVLYTPNQHYVTWDSGEGSFTDSVFSGPYPQLVYYGQHITAPAMEKTSGSKTYKFLYYLISYTDENGNTVTNQASELPVCPDYDLEITAIWESNITAEYTVNYYLQNLEDEEYNLVASTTRYGNDGTLTEADENLYEGFTAQPFDQQTILADNTTKVNIYYTRNTYTITWNADGGSFDDAALSAADGVQTLKYGAEVPSAPKVSKKVGTTDISFKTWQYSWADYADIKVSQENKPDYMPAADVTATAIWSDTATASYTVKYLLQDLDDEEKYTIADSQTKKLSGQSGTLTNAPVLSCAGFTMQPIEQQTIAIDGSTVVNIYYTRNTYTITWDAAGGSFDDSTLSAASVVQTIKYGAEVPSAPEVSKKAGTTDLSLLLWQYSWTDASGNAQTSSTPPAEMPASDITATAQWSENGQALYKIKHYLQNVKDNEYTLDSTDQQTGTSGSQTTAKAKTYTGFEPPAVEQQTIALDGSTVVNIYYTRNTYIITWDVAGGSFADSTLSAADGVQSFKYGAAISGAPEVTNSLSGKDYSLTKWTYTWTDASGTSGNSDTLPSTMPDYNITATAIWPVAINISINLPQSYRADCAVNDHTVTIYFADSSNETVTPASVTYEVYSGTSLICSGSGSTVIIPSQLAVSGLVVYVKAGIKDYTYDFDFSL